MSAGATVAPCQLLGWAELAAMLARWRAAAPRGEADAIARFGVGLETLARIENGDIEPDDELAARIRGAIGEAAPPGGPVPVFALHKGADGHHHIVMAFGEALHPLTIAAARDAWAELGDLLAIQADPRKFSA